MIMEKPPLERDITAEITAWLRRQEECWFYKVAAKPAMVKEGSFARQKTGIPDLLIVYHGRNVFIEIKRPGGKLRPNQQSEISKIIGAGGEVFVAFSLADVKKILVGE